MPGGPGDPVAGPDQYDVEAAAAGVGHQLIESWPAGFGPAELIPVLLHDLQAALTGHLPEIEELRFKVLVDGADPDINRGPFHNRQDSTYLRYVELKRALSPGLINFRKGDPYIKVDQGFARLPGSGYEATHPELKGLNPEDYPDITKLRILADVAPYSREYQRYASRVRAAARNNPDLEAEYTQITEQVRQTKESTLQIARKHFNAPIETVEGTVKQASREGVELAEYPGRVFHFSSVSSSMADLVAEELG